MIETRRLKDVVIFIQTILEYHISFLFISRFYVVFKTHVQVLGSTNNDSELFCSMFISPVTTEMTLTFI